MEAASDNTQLNHVWLSGPTSARYIWPVKAGPSGGATDIDKQPVLRNNHWFTFPSSRGEPSNNSMCESYPTGCPNIRGQRLAQRPLSREAIKRLGPHGGHASNSGIAAQVQCTVAEAAMHGLPPPQPGGAQPPQQPHSPQHGVGCVSKGAPSHLPRPRVRSNCCPRSCALAMLILIGAPSSILPVPVLSAAWASRSWPKVIKQKPLELPVSLSAMICGTQGTFSRAQPAGLGKPSQIHLARCHWAVLVREEAPDGLLARLITQTATVNCPPPVLPRVGPWAVILLHHFQRCVQSPGAGERRES